MVFEFILLQLSTPGAARHNGTPKAHYLDTDTIFIGLQLRKIHTQRFLSSGEFFERHFTAHRDPLFIRDFLSGIHE